MSTSWRRDLGIPTALRRLVLCWLNSSLSVFRPTVLLTAAFWLTATLWLAAVPGAAAETPDLSNSDATLEEIDTLFADPLRNRAFDAWPTCSPRHGSWQVLQYLPRDVDLNAYLVSRSLWSFPGLGSHRFIAIARYPGDPEVEIFSYSNSRGRMVRRVFGHANRLDHKAWRRLQRDMPIKKGLFRGVNGVRIDAPVWRVRWWAEHFEENMKYRLFGPNSNTASQAIANRAAGRPVEVYERRPFKAMGQSMWRRADFDPSDQWLPTDDLDDWQLAWSAPSVDGSLTVLPWWSALPPQVCRALP